MPTPDQLLDAAARLYADGGLSALTTAALARAAGTSKRAIYAAFPDRDAVVEALLLRRLDALDAALGAVPPGPFGERLGAFLELTLSLPREFPPAFWGELLRTCPAVAARLGARRDALMQARLHALVAEGVAAGELRADLPVDTLVAVAGVVGDALLRAGPALREPGARVLVDGLRVRR